jgi:hypothetical protein
MLSAVRKDLGVKALANGLQHAFATELLRADPGELTL